ncbi:Elongation factor 1-delta [Dissostichus eleginoides]|uniref:Elongation factor 1-delta n=1 Tax=Dissostichus eleginoides TaxID=100907 RepID=A0AAD9C990_DISEL|nr:Elongation factor 1-delta [Dissostichus eleginoides]
MSKKNPSCSALDQSEIDKKASHCQVDRSAPAASPCMNKAESGQRNGDRASSSPESGSLNGDGKRSGKSRRRKKRSSNPESQPEGTVDSKTKKEEKPDKRTSQPASDPRAGMMGLQSECANVWFERSMYEQAESLYQCWLASPSNGATKSKPSSPAPGKHSNSQSSVAPSSLGPVCQHGDQAESQYAEESVQRPIPNSLVLTSPPNPSITPQTPDEGYQSLAPTPATPVIQQAAVTPTNRQSINGLPRIPVELLRDVWLEKPLYDRAEATFYQNLYGNNSSKRSTCASTSRSSDHPQSLVEEEEEEEEEEAEEEAVEEKRVVPQGKAEIFHALLPIQEEEEPAEVQEKIEASGTGVCCFLHPDSERVWLDKWRYDAAESRFHGYTGSDAVVVKKARRTEAASTASTAPLRDNTMSSLDFLAQEKIWFDKPRYDDAERRFYERTDGSSQTAEVPAEVRSTEVRSTEVRSTEVRSTEDVGSNTILQDIARARENIQKSLAGLKTTLCNRGQPPLSQQSQPSVSGAGDTGEIICRIKGLELENHSLHQVVDDLRAALSKLECRVAVLEKSPAAGTPAAAPSVPYTNGTTVQQQKSAPVKVEEEEEDDDDDMDLFGSDEDDEEAEKLKEERLKAYAAKKSQKPVLIAKSSILLDVKPWDDETDMAKLEECVRSVQAEGLLWGSSKLVAVGYGIKKLQIACVVEDDKVGTDLLEEEITKFEDYIQSVDVAAFNKI